MALRPVFIVDIAHDDYVIERNIQFTWYPGFSKDQKQKSIKSLHESFVEMNGNIKILEISSSSTEALGVNLSAFNLMVKDSKENELFSVECLFQASKKFENGGPYKDILGKSSLEAKRDARLKNSGELVSFVHKKEEWALDPQTHYYDWIYINAVHQNTALAQELVKYEAFTDIQFNPVKSLNCQARSAALYVSLYRRGILNKVIGNKSYYKKIINKTAKNKQLGLFDD